MSPLRLIAFALLAGSLALAAITVRRARQVEPVTAPPVLLPVADSRELAGRPAALAGRYATGAAPGDRLIELRPDLTVAFAQRTPAGETPPDTDTFRLMLHDKRLHLATARRGGIAVQNLDTIVYFGDTYTRLR